MLTLAGLSLIAATPAFAAEPKSPVVPMAAASADRSAPADRTRYCVVTPPGTGTRIWRKECQSRADWLKTGFDPLTAKVVG